MAEENALLEALKFNFGFDKFKGNQEAIIKALLDGKDTFVLMPTGGGKSLCYQLPALMSEGTAIVISPLIALMKNQVDAMRHFSEDDGIAHFLNSSLNKAAIDSVKSDVISGKTKLLYVAPESLTKEDNINFLRTINISFYAVDEAHCISEWGHDFRPEYRKIRPIINEIGTRPVIALTATATPKVQHDIQKNLFEDYYNNNLLRFLSDTYLKNPGTQEKEPTGEGINYKNYAEAIYLYCLRKYKTPKEKIEKSEELIGRCRKSKIQRDFSVINEDDYTFDYKISFAEKALNLGEEAFVEYICRNYEIDRKNGAGSPITVANGQKTAFDYYNNLVTKIKELYKGKSEDIIYDSKFLKYLKYFKEYDDEGANEIVSIVGDYLSDENLFLLESDTQITRIRLIAVYFYYFQLESKYSLYADSVIDSYLNFCKGANEMLEASRYQKISEKNIFDMFVFFAAYMNKN